MDDTMRGPLTSDEVDGNWRGPLTSDEMVDLMDRIDSDDPYLLIFPHDLHVSRLRHYVPSSVFDAVAITNGKWTFFVEFWYNGTRVICGGNEPLESRNRTVLIDGTLILKIRERIIEEQHAYDQRKQSLQRS